MGDANETPIREIWHSQVWYIIRALHHPRHPWRELSSCDLCDYGGGPRPGLLPEVPDYEVNEETVQILLEHMRRLKVYQYPNHVYHINGIIYNDGTGYDFIG